MSELFPNEREQALEARLVELEMRVSFQEQALSELSEAQDVDFYFTISCDKEDLPVEVFDYCEEL